MVHHLARRTPDDTQQQAWRQDLAGLGFRSIHFREPGGVLLEIAADRPGFTRDEPSETLGTHLELPPRLQKGREDLEAALPKLVLPGDGSYDLSARSVDLAAVQEARG